jgi:hypothetical protein
VGPGQLWHCAQRWSPSSISLCTSQALLQTRSAAVRIGTTHSKFCEVPLQLAALLQSCRCSGTCAKPAGSLLCGLVAVRLTKTVKVRYLSHALSEVGGWHT